MTAGPTVAVVPGLCVASYLRPACDALAARGAQVALLRPPGWPGAAALRGRPGRLADLAAELARAVVAEDLRDVVLVGQSVGAQLAAHVAVAVPDRVRLLVLQGPVFDPRWRTTPAALRRWVADVPRERPSLLVSETPDWLRAGPTTIRHVLRLALSDALEETLASYAGEVAVLVGEHDTFSTRVWTRTLATSADLHVVLPGLPHSSPHADPDGFARALLTLLEVSRGRCPRRGAARPRRGGGGG